MAKKSAEPELPPASEVSGTAFAEMAVKLSRDRVSGFDEASAMLGILLTRAAVTHMSVSESTIHRPRSLSWSSYRILWMIWLFGHIEARDLARLSGVTRQTTSTVLSNLESKGLITRERASAADRRLIEISLTDAGRDEVETLFMRQNVLDSSVFSVLEPGEQQEFGGYLKRIIGAAVDESHRAHDAQ